MSTSLQCFRPLLRTRLRSPNPKTSIAYLRFYSATEAFASKEIAELDQSSKLTDAKIELYPRLRHHDGIEEFRAAHFLKTFQQLTNGDTLEERDVSVNGRVTSLRSSGAKLLFIDVIQGGQKVQGLCDLARLSQAGINESEFRRFTHQIKRGDIYRIKGLAHKTARGQVSVLATQLPELLSPCLHDLPTRLEDRQSRIRNRHIDLLVNKQPTETLHLRSQLIKHLRQLLEDEEFTEVQTPVLASNAEGAIARPFQTAAAEFPDRHIALRIAPELWLKRLIIGGFDRVFEIGPCFRNEGMALWGDILKPRD
ncbi:MAG: hypothetical protein Q9190_007629 [Brigantiaea leucoxantha]